MRRVRILLAEKQKMIAEAFRNLLELRYEVVGIVTGGRALLKVAPELKPDIAILDIGMPLLNGLDASRELKRLLPHVKIIFVTTNDDPDIANGAQRPGAPYLLRPSVSAELLTAVREVRRGNSGLTPRISERLRPEFIKAGAKRCARHVTTRQQEVLRLLAQGRTMQEVADILQITPRTVAFHKYHVMDNFSLQSNAELIRFVVREGIIKSA
jgi:DNA-binding NarL/FixJ family response regulator